MENFLKVTSTLKEGVLKNKAYTLKPIDCPIKLNQNESPFDIPLYLKEKILQKLKNTKWNIYPEFVPDDLYTKIANYFNLSKTNILVGNGSNEMIFTILAASAEKTKKVVIPTPTFTVYNLISSNLNATIKYVPLNEDFTFNVPAIIEESKTSGSITVLCSPNNPTGTYLTFNEIEKIISSSGGIVIVDEAYIHFGGETVLDLIPKYNNLIILRTFSKAFGLAGLRIGFMISNKDLITELSKVKLPYNLNIFTLITLSEIFDNLSLVEENIKTILSEKKFLASELSKFKDLKVIPSEANFFLIKFFDSNFVFAKLVEDGILIRDYNSYPMLENCLRVSVGSRKENEAFINSLKKIFKYGEKL
ncbi:MAG: histidinol-phosphate transaminase [Spirochaetes bacterium GWD1_27_9]|nr:MAG: histidinol-phosphate transaminase [Spirochaetes bacterium GWC1_27_15]OHD30297.1 MAG: histidinol-phosphate transaminase [Spirochaetes bacterium GWD1_27_9]